MVGAAGVVFMLELEGVCFWGFRFWLRYYSDYPEFAGRVALRIEIIRPTPPSSDCCATIGDVSG